MAVLLPWNALAAGRPDLLWPGVVAIADLVPAALLARGAWLRGTWRRRGAARLGFDRFPFFLGEPFEAVLSLDTGSGGKGAVEVSLACWERRPVEEGGRWREVEVYRAVQVIALAAETEVTFELPDPDRELGTALRAPEARRWELRLQGRAGARVEATFPVPGLRASRPGPTSRLTPGGPVPRQERMADLDVIGIAGSLRRDSHNRALLRLARELAPPGMALRTWEGLAGLPFYDGDLEEKGMPGPVVEMNEEIRRAGAVLVVTPEYSQSVPGVLKNALDWAARPPGKSPFRGKVVAITGASPGALGTARAQMDLRRILAAMGAIVDPVAGGARLPGRQEARPLGRLHRRGDAQVPRQAPRGAAALGGEVRGVAADANPGGRGLRR